MHFSASLKTHLAEAHTDAVAHTHTHTHTHGVPEPSRSRRKPFTEASISVNSQETLRRRYSTIIEENHH